MQTVLYIVSMTQSSLSVQLTMKSAIHVPSSSVSITSVLQNADQNAFRS